MIIYRAEFGRVRIVLYPEGQRWRAMLLRGAAESALPGEVELAKHPGPVWRDFFDDLESARKGASWQVQLLQGPSPEVREPDPELMLEWEAAEAAQAFVSQVAQAGRFERLGRNSARIESEYLERLNKVRFGIDNGWQPPGLLMQGGDAHQRSRALDRLKQLAEGDGFFCSHIVLDSNVQLRDTQRVCRAAIEAAGLPGESSGADSHAELQRLLASVRSLGRNGWVLLFDSVDRFEGTARKRAESYRELARWRGGRPDGSYLGLFCVLAVTPEYAQAVFDDTGDLRMIRGELGASNSPADRQLLDAAETGIRALEHEQLVRELLVLEW